MIETREPIICVPYALSVSGALSVSVLESTTLGARPAVEALLGSTDRTGPHPSPSPIAEHADMELLTIDEVSALMKCTPKGLRDRVDAGEFPKPRRFGRNIRWRAVDLRAWLDTGNG
jgi:predicted DNA-binding transcriptional regulator AlpA